jgi:hypothetical protein
MLPELRFIETIGNKHLFTYNVDYYEHYAYISEDSKNKFKIEIGEKPHQIIMLVEKQSKMGKDITKKITKN